MCKYNDSNFNQKLYLWEGVEFSDLMIFSMSSLSSEKVEHEPPVLDTRLVSLLHLQLIHCWVIFVFGHQIIFTTHLVTGSTLKKGSL